MTTERILVFLQGAACQDFLRIDLEGFLMPHHTLMDKLKELREKIAAAVQAQEEFVKELHDIAQLIGDCADSQPAEG